MSSIEQKLDEILSQLKSLDERMGRIEDGSTPMVKTEITPPEPKGSKKMSIKEFILQFNAKKGVDKTLAVAYFLEIHEGMSSFNKADLEQGYRQAKESVPLNINDDVYKCVKRGLMMENKEKKENTKAWVITNSGEAYLKELFSKE